MKSKKNTASSGGPKSPGPKSPVSKASGSKSPGPKSPGSKASNPQPPGPNTPNPKYLNRPTPSKSKQCAALTADGLSCERPLGNPAHDYCHPCHQQLVRLNDNYKRTEEEYERGRGKGVKDVAAVGAQIALLGRVLDGRGEVYNRFYSGSSDTEKNQRHSSWVLKQRREMEVLEERLKVLESAGSKSAKGAGAGTAKTVASPPPSPAKQPQPASKKQSKAVVVLDVHPDTPKPREPGASFQPNVTVATIRRMMDNTHQPLLQKLFAMVPSLRDDDEDVSDLSDHVVRFIFREYVLCSDDEDTIARATAAKSICAFLRDVSVDELQEYINFFGLLGTAQPGTWRFLRDGVTDALLPPTAPATVILGGRVAKDRADRRVTLEGWDVLHESFSNIVGGHNIESFCYCFDDVALAKGCIALNRYGNIRDDPDGWLDEERDSSHLCGEGLHLGFVGLAMGSSNQKAGVHSVRSVYVEGEFRNYFSGRISKSNPLALPLIRELKSRVAELLVNAYDGPSAWPYQKKVVGIEQKPWIKRIRRSGFEDRLIDTPWEVDWTYESVLKDIDSAYSLRMEVMTDFYQVVVVDRVPNRNNRLPQIVGKALLEISGHGSIADVLEHFVQDFPAREQTIYRHVAADLRQKIPGQVSRGSYRFDSQRERAWDVSNDYVIERLQQMSSHTPTTSRVVRAMTSDMEARGLLTRLDELPSELDIPVVIRGIDGVDDVYFNYASQNTDEVEQNLSAKGLARVPSLSCLHNFAAQYAERFRSAIFAQGRIHVHYCAWPITFSRKWCFRTIEGHVFRWNVLPFDAPLSSHIWHQFLDERMHRRFPFVRFAHTSFVVCATSLEQAQYRIQQLKAEASTHGWALEMPEPRFWTSNYESLDLRRVWMGVPPEGYERKDPEQKDAEGGGCCVM